MGCLFSIINFSLWYCLWHNVFSV